MVDDLSVVWISMAVIVLCWAVVRINQKIDEIIRNHKYNNALDDGILEDSRTEARRQTSGPSRH